MKSKEKSINRKDRKEIAKNAKGNKLKANEYE
jgi:hypothetical protein